jgi:CBS domain-containing protein
MFSQRIKSVMDRSKVLTASPETSVVDAAKLMEQKSVSAVLVISQEKLVGIFTERDAVFRVIARGMDVRTTRLGDVMTPSPVTVTPEKSFGYALLLMHENGFRHVPVVVDGMPVGIVSARSALDPDLEEFVSEEQRRRHIK